MKLKIEITMDNAAFEDGNGTEVCNILKRFSNFADGLELHKGQTGRLRDTNGNTVGEWKVTP